MNIHPHRPVLRHQLTSHSGSCQMAGEHTGDHIHREQIRTVPSAVIRETTSMIWLFPSVIASQSRSARGSWSASVRGAFRSDSSSASWRSGGLGCQRGTVPVNATTPVFSEGRGTYDIIRLGSHTPVLITPLRETLYYIRLVAHEPQSPMTFVRHVPILHAFFSVSPPS